MAENIGFGVDVGGSGIKGGVVDLDTGELVGERIKILTPQPATPDAVAETIAEIVRIAGWEGPVGVTLPSVIRDQTALLAANIDESWVDMDCRELFSRHLPDHRTHVLNDADAAGLAEARFGDAHARQGSVVLLTFGTGIGSALLHDGLLYPNSELGHLHIGDDEAEHIASAAAKEREDLSYKKWAKRVSKVLRTYEALFWPTLFVVGGGISRKHEKWVPLLECRTPVVPAKLHNNAGIAGAALAASEGLLP
ncbi:polyphosphate--glucose phosphotransferase [Corynebacterium hansenii]|uniref:Polyphosphate--glucose phosphotransferase n=1 Tax=Corynebacterium hansenii TaxID=394964 RepID=A0ABV7ZQB8_9CORY|nr:ROK family protein [Corynebacterium hansenii]WJY99860.1 Polyphosphate glucokinase [Corynebacterium hansenii]